MAGIITEETVDILTKEYKNWLDSDFTKLIIAHINELVYALQQERRGSEHEYDIGLQTRIDCYKDLLQIHYDVYRKQLEKYRAIIDRRKIIDTGETKVKDLL